MNKGDKMSSKEKEWRIVFDLPNVILKNCPFCGSSDLLKQTTNSNAYWIVCNNCAGETQSGHSWEEAVHYWNKRI